MAREEKEAKGGERPGDGCREFLLLGFSGSLRERSEREEGDEGVSPCRLGPKREPLILEEGGG